jgi:hypothetical protein
MATPRSESEETYRRQAAAYLQAVRDAMSWSLVELGRAGGFADHTAVSKALKLKHTMAFEAILAIEEVTRLAIPDTLKAAAIAVRQHRAVEPLPADELRRQAAAFLEAMKDMEPKERKKLIRELLKG